MSAKYNLNLFLKCFDTQIETKYRQMDYQKGHLDYGEKQNNKSDHKIRKDKDFVVFMNISQKGGLFPTKKEHGERK